MAAIDKKLVVEIIGDASSLQKTYGQVIDASKRFGKEVEKNGFDLQKFGKTMTVVGGAIVGALTATVIAVSKSAGEIEHLSRVAGVGAEQFQKLAYAAKQDDVDIQKLSTGMTRLSRGMQEASEGTGEAIKAFKAIGVNVQTADGKLRATDKVLLDVADRFSKMTNPAEKSALAMQIFGKAGADLVPFLEQGRDGIEKLGAEAERMGLVLSDEAVANLDLLGDELDNIKAGIGGFGNSIASDLAPYLIAMVNGLKSAIELFNQIPGPIRQAITVATAFAGAVALVGGAFITLAPAIWAAMGPLLPFIAGAAALGAAAVVVYNNWNKVAAFFMTVWDKVVANTKIVWGGIRAFVLGEIAIILKGLQLLTGWIPSWGDKLKGAVAGVEKQLHAAVSDIQTGYAERSKNNYNEHYKWMVAHNKKKNDTITKQDKEAEEQRRLQTKAELDAKKKAEEAARKEAEAKAKQAAAERLRNEEAWADRLFDATHNELERLNREEQKALQQANLTDKAKADIKAYYAQKRIDLAKSEAKKLKEIEEKKTKEEAEQAAERRRIYEEEEAARTASLNNMSDLIVGYLNQLGEGQASFKDILKSILIDQLSAWEQASIADTLKGIASAWANAIWNPGGLALIPQMIAQGAAAVAGIEAAKVGIRGLAEGGLATGPSFNLIGEGDYQEAVLPLSADVFNKIGMGIVGNLPKGQNINNQNSNQVINNNFNIGGYIDKSGLKRLVRDIDPILTAEKSRRGLK